MDWMPRRIPPASSGLARRGCQRSVSHDVTDRCRTRSIKATHPMTVRGAALSRLTTCSCRVRAEAAAWPITDMAGEGASSGFLESGFRAFPIAKHPLHPEPQDQNPQNGQKRSGQNKPPNSKETSKDRKSTYDESW